MKIKGVMLVGLLLAGAQVHADDGLTISGWVDVNVERLGSANGDSVGMSSGGLNSSRLVFSDSENLGAGWKAFFTYEMQFAANTGAGPTPRQSFVGATGPYGTLSLGRQNTPSYWVAGYADPSWSADFSMVSNMEFFYAPYRESNSINYNTPRIGGFQGRFMYSTGANDGTRNGRYLSTGVDYRNGPLYAGIVSDLTNTKNLYSSDIPTSRDNYFVATYSFGNLEPTFIYHTYNGYYAYPPYTAFQSKGWDVQIGARYNLSDRHSFFASYVRRKDDYNVSLSDANGGVVGYDYHFSKRTDMYFNYARILAKNQTAIQYPVTFSSYPTPTSGVQIGLRHGF
ncbi:porin [Glaciimonas soli]|uniref:Porin n=1 Tax=Glaciimonas soli TaxID=2590999 RepID=A0A843YN03_9BURK|nr:porin [Glaciimonas soli]MQR00845.1 porin [Glaciimonas soli]